MIISRRRVANQNFSIFQALTWVTVMELVQYSHSMGNARGLVMVWLPSSQSEICWKGLGYSRVGGSECRKPQVLFLKPMGHEKI